MALPVSSTSAVTRATIRSESFEEEASAVVLRSRPLTVLLPSHACTSIELGGASEVIVAGRVFSEFELIPAPFAEREHLSVLRCVGETEAALRSVLLPRKPPYVAKGSHVTRLSPGPDGSEMAKRGLVVDVMKAGTERTILTNIPAAPGDSGSPLVVADEMVAICMGMTGDDGVAIAVPLSIEILTELRRIASQRRQWTGVTRLLGALRTLLASAIRAWSAFELAGVDGPMNTVQDVESPKSLTAHNGRMITLRPTWKRTFPTSIRWWQSFPAFTGGRDDRIAVGTRIEGKTPGAIFLLNENGRIEWSYSIPDGECVYSNEKIRYDGFYVFRMHVGDLTGDGKNELVVAFVQRNWFPCKVMVFDLDGEILGEYWHPGYIRKFCIGRVAGHPEPLLIMAGNSNRFRASLNSANPHALFAFSGSSLRGEGPPYPECCSAGNELWYYLLTSPNHEYRCEFDSISVVGSNQEDQSMILAHTTDGRFYYLRADGRIARVDVGDNFRQEFGRVEPPMLQRIDLRTN